MKERLLVLAKAAPIVSTKYENLVCVAGITDKGEWRRLYPIPWKCFWGRSPNQFSKKQWIEYELRSDEPSDHRPESRKVKYETIRAIGTASFKDINAIIQPKLTTLEKLVSIGPRKASLGIVRPAIDEFYEMTNAQYEKWTGQKAQTTLNNTSAQPLEIPQKKYGYKFRDSKTGAHALLCEDWEIAELYRNCEEYRKKGKYKDDAEVFEKIKQKMFNELPAKKDLYFVVGTHFRFPTYMIVGALYPKKTDKY